MDNRTFFKRVRDENKMSLIDIFSDMTKKHTKEERDRVFIAGTEFTTPNEAEMLAGWTKPFLFFRFFMICLVGFIALYLFALFSQGDSMYYFLDVGIPFVVPITFILLIWEMHIPRNISLLEVIWMTAVGGVLSICATLLMQIMGMDIPSPAFAGVLEEPAKLLLIYFFLKRKNYKYALNGVLIGAAVGAGFAMFESMMYSVRGMLQVGVQSSLWYLMEYGAGENAYWYGYVSGLEFGLSQAFVRAITGIAGHGMWAALYGGILVMEKKDEPIEVKHFASIRFLIYFILSVVLHAYHNSGISISHMLGIEFTYQDSDIYYLDILLEVVLNVAIFLPVLTKAVNQIVQISADANDGRVTKAVFRTPADAALVGQSFSQAAFYIEGTAGAAIGQNYAIMEGERKYIGRIPEHNDIAFPSCRDISARHCVIFVQNGMVYVQDLGSTNGTYVGVQRLSPQQAVPVAGQSIYLGSRTCGFRIRSNS